jgi:murein DD-endopeptidase MepM/ murein hydrolase activator NlpD
VYAAYDGYLTRLPGWISAVIIRHPRDPLAAEPRQIWTYYAHMASKDGVQSYISAQFPPGTSEVFVPQGTLLGYQGLYSGNSTFAIGLHVHFSIVLSEANGSFKNESSLSNTLDPSPYLGLPVNANNRPALPVRCGT